MKLGNSKKPLSPFRKPQKYAAYDEVGSGGLIDPEFDDVEEYQKNVVQKLRDRGAL